MSDAVVHIADRVRELVEPYDHVERHLIRFGGREKTREHRSRHPSLLNQLRAAVKPGPGDEQLYAVPRSAPPVVTGPLDVLLRIEAGSAHWLSMRIGLPLRATVENNLRALVGHAPELDDLDQLHHDIDTWWTWARVETGWDGRPRDLRDPCPYCAERLLRVRHDATAAWCRGCAAAWDATQLGLLGEMIDQFKATRAERLA